MAIWAELKKVVNSDFSKPLNELINAGVPVKTLSGKIVKSVQRGTIGIAAGTASGTATISSVTTNKSIVLYTGTQYKGSSSYPSAMPALVLTSATTLTATRFAYSDTTAVVVPYQVIEFY